MTWLIDKSALVHLHASPDAQAWLERIERGLVRIATVTRLEIGYSSRSADEWRQQLLGPPVSSMPVDYVTPTIEDRALQLQGELSERGHHRAPSVPDLLIAATAEINGHTVLHNDKDFELIGEITRQNIERIIPLAT